jgi:hypothetical protein
MNGHQLYEKNSCAILFLSLLPLKRVLKKWRLCDDWISSVRCVCRSATREREREKRIAIHSEVYQRATAICMDAIRLPSTLKEHTRLRRYNEDSSPLRYCSHYCCRDRFRRCRIRFWTGDPRRLNRLEIPRLSDNFVARVDVARLESDSLDSIKNQLPGNYAGRATNGV